MSQKEQFSRRGNIQSVERIMSQIQHESKFARHASLIRDMYTVLVLSYAHLFFRPSLKLYR